MSKLDGWFARLGRILFKMAAGLIVYMLSIWYLHPESLRAIFPF